MADNLIGRSTDPNTAGVLGEGFEDKAGTGVYGRDRGGAGNGVIGYSDHGRGVWGHSNDNGGGVLGESVKGLGVHGRSQEGFGVLGESVGAGVVGKSATWHGVAGFSESSTGGFGVYGEAVGPGVVGVSKTWHGVAGKTSSSTGGAGVIGEHEGSGPGVLATSKLGVGLHATGGRLAAFFDGDVEVTGDIRLSNADCAEDFDVCSNVQVEPGTVMVVGSDSALEPSTFAYDKRVAGVVSGAGHYKPAIVLDKQPSPNNREPIALVGKVFCKVDAHFGAITTGDLLTTSPTPGHAMKAQDPARAFGAVIGKALKPCAEGQGLIPILVALQ